MSETFEPKIVVFCCNWCSYTAADLAGTSRMHYAHNIRIIRVMCSGRVEPMFVMKALREGADGVMIAGCHPGDCHYINGNFKTLRRFPLLHTMLSQFGVEPERVALIWASASEADQFVEAVDKLVAKVRALGPLGWAKKADLAEMRRSGTQAPA